ncbi:MAG: RidA family protein [Deltaproteobacteria bacterium]|nr:RidA family protein [Deltaproteobacteria bacterium]
MQFVSTSEAPQAIGPYSQGVIVGNLLFISGQLPIDPSTGDFVSGGIKEKTYQIIKNLEAIAKAANSDLSNVIKTTIFLSNMVDYPVVNDVYAQYFIDSFPARSVVQVAGLPKNSEIEMEAILYLERID